MDGICLIGTQGKQPAGKTTRQDSLFTGKHAEFAMRHFLVFVLHVFATDIAGSAIMLSSLTNCLIIFQLHFHQKDDPS